MSRSTQCSTSVDYTHRVATLDALPGVVVFDELTPPTVVKPLASNQYYCIIAGADPSDGRTDTDATYTTIRGYVQSGTAPTSPFTSKGHTATGF